MRLPASTPLKYVIGLGLPIGSAPRVRCIDHIQELIHSEANRHLEISEAAGLFKQLAKDLRIPVLILSQLNREVEKSADKRPTLAHLKESGDIEAKADVVFLLFRQHYYFKDADPELTELNVTKNRDGRCGIFELSWSPEVMRFEEFRHSSPGRMVSFIEKSSQGHDREMGVR
jgi:replicative DNA helicase